MITQKIIARTDSLKLDKIISRYGEDSMRQVVFIIVRPDPDSEELIPITIPEDAVGSFRILKPSGNFVIVPMSKSVLASGETAFDVVLPVSANTAKGSGYYDIRITSETDKYYFTAQGDFIIDDNIISDEVLEDVSEVNGLIFPDDFLTVEDHVAYIDDDVTSTESTWSSNKISEEIEAHAGGDVSKTVSGNPVTFTDGAFAPLVKCVTAITGSQDLHGYDKPWVGGAGKNKLPLVLADIKARNTSGTWSGNNYTRNGVTFSVITDESENITGIKATGTATANTAIDLSVADVANDTPVILNGCPSGGSDASYYIGISSLGYHCIGSDVYYNNYSNFVIYCFVTSGYAIPSGGVIFTPMVRLASETDPTFAPYSNICPITAYNQSTISVGGRNEYVTTNTIAQSNSAAVDIVNATSIRVYRRAEGTYPASKQLLSNYNFVEGKTYKVKAYANVVSGIAEIAIRDSSNNPVSASSQITTSGNLEMNFTYDSNTMSYLSFFATYNQTTGGDVTYERIAIYDIDIVPTTHTAQFSNSIYQGNADFVGGVATFNKIFVELKTLSYDGTSAGGLAWFDITVPASAKLSDILSDRVDITAAEGWQSTTPIIQYNSSLNRLRVYGSQALFTTGVYADAQMVYPLSTPTTETITPTNLPIKSLNGYTHIESSTGEMEVEYITQRFQPLIDSIAQL